MFIFAALPAHAQQVTLSINPPIVEAMMKPGKSILIGYTLQNQGDPTAMSIKVRTFSPQGDYGGMAIDDDQQSPIRFSLDNTDLAFDKPFFMKQRDVTQALLRIRVPENTPEGDYYFVFLAETEATPAVGGISTPLAKATIGSTLLVTVSESGITQVKPRISLFDMTPDFTVKLFGSTYRIMESGSLVPVRLIIQNQGDNLIKPQGKITLRGGLGEKHEYQLLPQNILSQSGRLIKAEGGGNSSPEQSLLISGYFIGSYALSASANFGDNTPQLFASTTFIALPLRFMIVTAGIIFLSAAIIIAAKKKKK